MKSSLVTLVMVMVGLVAYAHPPKSVGLSYDAESGVLSIDAAHSVKDVASHYVDQVEILLNGEQKELLKAEKQGDSDHAIFTYEIGSLQVGDVVEVVAHCNKVGKRSAKLVIE